MRSGGEEEPTDSQLNSREGDGLPNPLSGSASPEPGPSWAPVQQNAIIKEVQVNQEQNQQTEEQRLPLLTPPANTSLQSPPVFHAPSVCLHWSIHVNVCTHAII